MTQQAHQPTLDAVAEMARTIARQVGTDADARESLRYRRDDAREIVRWVRPCDGIIPADVKLYLEECRRALNATHQSLTGAPVNIIEKTARGPLGKALEGFVAGTGKPKKEITWAEMEQFIVENFISANESERIKYDLDNVRQKDGEAIASFNRRFRQMADTAYPTSNEDSVRIVLAAYIRALRDQGLARRIIYKKKRNAKEAMELAEAEGNCDDLIQAMHLGRTRHEEPMDIGALGRPSSSDNGSSMWKVVEALQHQVKQQSMMIEQLCSLVQNQGIDINSIHQMRESPRKNAPNQQKKSALSKKSVKCFGCGKMGHYKRDCRSKVNNNNSQQQQKPMTCFSCGKAGHRAANCRQKNITCYKCQQTGHYQSQCPLNQQNQPRQGFGSPPHDYRQPPRDYHNQHDNGYNAMEVDEVAPARVLRRQSVPRDDYDTRSGISATPRASATSRPYSKNTKKANRNRLNRDEEYVDSDGYMLTDSNTDEYGRYAASYQHNNHSNSWADAVRRPGNFVGGSQ